MRLFPPGKSFRVRSGGIRSPRRRALVGAAALCISGAAMMALHNGGHPASLAGLEGMAVGFLVGLAVVLLVAWRRRQS